MILQRIRLGGFVMMGSVLLAACGSGSGSGSPSGNPSSNPSSKPSNPLNPPDPAPDPDAGSDPQPGPSPGPVPTVELAAAAPVVDPGDSTRLTWSSANATSCAAGGGWIGSRPLSGSERSGPLTRQTTFSLSCSGSGGSAVEMISVAVNGAVVLRWRPPDRDTDGLPLTTLNAYRIYFGQNSRSYSGQVEIAAPATSHAVTLPSGNYYFAMTAVDGDGDESGYSNEVLRNVP